MREYLVYRIFNLLTPRSFRARLAKATYVDAASGMPLTTRYGMFLEDDDDVARRMDGRIAELFNASFKEVDAESQTLMFLFEYMIGSTDLSIIKLHNVRLVQDRARVLYPVPYNFDLSGLVDTSYSLVDKRLGIASVRDRLYRGPCRTAANWSRRWRRCARPGRRCWRCMTRCRIWTRRTGATPRNISRSSMR